MEVYEMGSIDVQIFKDKVGDIQTDKVILTAERLEHIRNHHPQDVPLFEKYGKQCICKPDVIIKDGKNIGTVFMVKRLSDTNLNVVLRLALVSDKSSLKNSIMTFWRIRDRNLQKLIEKGEVLYKRE